MGGERLRSLNGQLLDSGLIVLNDSHIDKTASVITVVKRLSHLTGVLLSEFRLQTLSCGHNDMDRKGCNGIRRRYWEGMTFSSSAHGSKFQLSPGIMGDYLRYLRDATRDIFEALST